MYTEKIKEICENFYNVTGFTTFYISSDLNIKEISKGFLAEHLYLLDLKEVMECVRQRLEKKQQEHNSFITCCTYNHCIYNLSFVKWKNGEIGAFAFGVMTIIPFSEAQVEALYKNCKNSISKTNFIKIVSKITTVTYLHLHNLGKAFLAITHTLSDDVTINQLFHEDPILKGQITERIDNLPQYQLSSRIGELPRIPAKFYYELKSLVTTGDMDGMKHYTENLNFVLTDELVKNDSLRSLKISLTAVAVLCFTFAMEANAPYYKLSNMTLSFFSQIEVLNSDRESSALIKNILLSYTKIVSITSFPSYSRPVKIAIQYIQKNYYQKITLAELSTIASVSSYYLSALIKKETGLSLTDNINKIRVDASKYLLKNTDLTVLEIAQNTGFCYQNHFSSVFKKFAGVSPTQYRNKRKEII